MRTTAAARTACIFFIMYIAGFWPVQGYARSISHGKSSIFQSRGTKKISRCGERSRKFIRLAWQNFLADRYGLTRFDEEMIRESIESGTLVRVPDKTDAFYLDPHMEYELRYVVPSVRQFLDERIAEFSRTLRRVFKITSLVRTKERQEDLERKGESDANHLVSKCRSVHTTGAAFDVSKKDLGWRATRWMRRELRKLEKEGLVHVIDESSNFHIFVSPDYPKPFQEFPPTVTITNRSSPSSRYHRKWSSAPRSVLMDTTAVRPW